MFYNTKIRSAGMSLQPQNTKLSYKKSDDVTFINS